MTDQELKDWLNQEPPKTEKNEDGGLFVGIVSVENDLSEIDECWSTNHFQARFAKNGDVGYISGSVELQLTMFGMLRTLVGAATLKLSDDITHSEAILLSEATKSAAKKLGRRFGKYLNDRGSAPDAKEGASIASKRVPRSKQTGVKMPPDASVMRLYADAIAKGDQEKITALLNTYNIKTEADYAS